MRVASAALAVAGFMAVGGCELISGLGDFSDRGAAAGGGGAGAPSNGGVGATGGTGGDAPPGGGGQGTGGAGEGGSCRDTIECFAQRGAGSAPCTREPAPPGCPTWVWDYCACSTGQAPALFFDPPSGTGSLQEVVFVGYPEDGPYNLLVDSSCVDVPDYACDACGVTVYGFTDLSTAATPLSVSGPHLIQIWQHDVGAPCSDIGGGDLLMQADYEVVD